MDDSCITRAISLCKTVVSSFSYSWRKRRELAEVQIQLGLPAHHLITESVTRWGSRQQMIEHFLEQEGAITKVLSANKKSRHLVPTWQNIEVLEAIQKALKLLQDFTDALSGEEYVTISYVRPVLHLFNASLLAHKDDDSELCKSIKTCIVDYLNAKYADPATWTWPHFWTHGSETNTYQVKKINAVKNQAVLEAESLQTDQGSYQPDTAEHMVPVPLPTDQVIMPPTAKKKKSLASFFKQSTGITRRELIEK
nr:uncharacterized protein LOC129437603 [Misgurnus anguillicaudatus]